MIFGNFQYVWSRCYVWYTSDIKYNNTDNIVFASTILRDSQFRFRMHVPQLVPFPPNNMRMHKREYPVNRWLSMRPSRQNE